ncbi:hypothetical protein ADK76_10785 [Streptomyces griseoflavus]|nr:hypothetical protein ADK76_10785 [Streptomyces griseoflavus]
MMGATVCRLVLADRLGRMRRSRGLTLKTVAGALYVSSSKLCRIESGRHRPTLADVEQLADLYEVETDVRTQLLQWAQVAQGRSSYHAFADVADAVLRDYLDVEQAGLRAVFGPVVLPAVLRTRGYARALYGGMGEAEAERRLSLLELRQRHFADAGPKPVRILLGEAALYGRLSGAEMMRKQHQWLRQAAELGVKLRVLPYERMALERCALSAFAVAAVNDDRCVLTARERMGGVWLGPDRNGRAAAWFEHLWQAAAEPGPQLAA